MARWVAGLGFAGLVTCFGLYLSVPDWAAGFTFVPPWVWLIPGLLWTGLALWLERRLGLALLAGWLLFGLVIPEEGRALFGRGGEDGELRVVSLNCSSRAAVIERLAELKPDVVLLQESPRREELAQALERLWQPAHVSWGPEASIASRFALETVDLPSTQQVHVHRARLLLPAGPLELASLRLRPPIVRFDPWRPSYWADHRAARRERTEVVSGLMSGFEADLVAGDFNSPAHDRVFKLMAPLRDAYGQAGHGWPNTVSDDLPLYRFDQVWLGQRLEATDLRTVSVEGTDHRAVVCDLRWK
ncbi:MAG: endonuclease/exonuclease/phosphatase family protein [Vulcanimicrobiota bacterium]